MALLGHNCLQALATALLPTDIPSHYLPTTYYLLAYLRATVPTGHGTTRDSMPHACLG